MKNLINLQDAFLNTVRREKINIEVLLTNGTILRGNVLGFDNYTIVIETQNKNQRLIYKHAVATLKPDKSVDFLYTYKNYDNSEKEKIDAE